MRPARLRPGFTLWKKCITQWRRKALRHLIALRTSPSVIAKNPLKQVRLRSDKSELRRDKIKIPILGF